MYLSWKRIWFQLELWKETHGLRGTLKEGVIKMSSGLLVVLKGIDTTICTTWRVVRLLEIWQLKNIWKTTLPGYGIWGSDKLVWILWKHWQSMTIGRCIDLQFEIWWMLCSGQEDEGEIWYRDSPLGRYSWLCSRWCLRSYQDCITWRSSVLCLVCWWFI